MKRTFLMIMVMSLVMSVHASPLETEVMVDNFAEAYRSHPVLDRWPERPYVELVRGNHQ